MPSAIVRPVPDSFENALTATPPDEPIRVAQARSEHAQYVEALVAVGLEVHVVAPDERCPDSCFVEDTAIVAGGVAISTRPGAPSRRAEVGPVSALLARHIEVLALDRGTLDGGDCLRLGKTVFVGRTARSNDEGIAALSTLLAPRGVRVVPVEVPRGVLHLKCVCSPLDDERVLLAEGSLNPRIFGPARALLVPEEESYAANVVTHGQAALVAEGFPRTRALLEQTGFTTHTIDNRELRKADSALTCLSILVP